MPEVLGGNTTLALKLFPLARARAARTKPRFIEIDRYGERLTGCIECNQVERYQSAFLS